MGTPAAPAALPTNLPNGAGVSKKSLPRAYPLRPPHRRRHGALRDTVKPVVVGLVVRKLPLVHGPAQPSFRIGYSAVRCSANSRCWTALRPKMERQPASPIADVFEHCNAFTSGISIIRLQGSGREEMEERTGRVWDKVIEPKPGGIKAAASIVRANMKRGVRTFRFRRSPDGTQPPDREGSEGRRGPLRGPSPGPAGQPFPGARAADPPASVQKLKGRGRHAGDY